MSEPTTVVDEVRPEDFGDAAAGYHILVLGPDQTAAHQFPTKRELLIGRADKADVRLLDDRASREHARLYLGDVLELEDLNSNNGSFLRDRKVPPNQRVRLAPGEVITIGSTVLFVQRREPTRKPRLVSSHRYFETRLIEECARADDVHGDFALVRLHAEASDARRCEGILAAALCRGDVLGAYGPREYELLLAGPGKEQATDDRAEAMKARQNMRRGVEDRVEQLEKDLKDDGIAARSGLAFFPADGVSPQELVSKACSHLRGTSGIPQDTVLENSAMRKLYVRAEQMARGRISVLLLGESGVGKEILAQHVHRSSPRVAERYLRINCAALSESLLESELFGHEKGAFTGAVKAKIGLIEEADKGTLFLDEVGEMPLNLQAKLLIAIESGTVMPVGATKERQVDVRFIAATNRDIQEEIAANRFRNDLFFRLAGEVLTIPPLRERPDEIELLARRFVDQVSAELKQPAPQLSRAAVVQLRSYAWPGNVRELRNVMERAVLLCEGHEIYKEHVIVEALRAAPEVAAETPPPGAAALPAEWTKERTMKQIEREALLDALGRCAGNQRRAAELLRMPLRTFVDKLTEHNIPRPRRRARSAGSPEAE